MKNAVEAMNKNGTLVLRSTTQGAQLTVTVSDNGPGMSPEILNKILGRQGYTNKQDGHGIGMSVIKETIEALGGEFSLTSATNKGTSAIIRLPLANMQS